MEIELNVTLLTVALTENYKVALLYTHDEEQVEYHFIMLKREIVMGGVKIYEPYVMCNAYYSTFDDPLKILGRSWLADEWAKLLVTPKKITRCGRTFEREEVLLYNKKYHHYFTSEKEKAAQLAKIAEDLPRLKSLVEEAEKEKKWWEDVFENMFWESAGRYHKAASVNPAKDTILEELKITTRIEWKKWLLKNHPDKTHAARKDSNGDVIPPVPEDIVKRVISVGQSKKW